MGLYDLLIQGSDYQSVRACLSEQFSSPDYPAALHILHLIPRIISVSRYGSKSDLMFYLYSMRSAAEVPKKEIPSPTFRPFSGG